jgi:dipeptidyl-peptidase-4
MGLRGRLAILSEGYSNADFRTRASATYNFVHEILNLAAEQRETIKSLVLASNRRRPDSVAVRSVLAPPTTQDVIAEITRESGEGSGGFARRQRTGGYRTVRMPVFDHFVAARKELLPAAYLLPPRFTELVELLRRQGILVDVLHEAGSAPTEVFTVDSLSVGALFEGHRTIQAEGRWSNEPTNTTLAAGWYLVRTDQPLGVLAAYVLEPASEDGLVTWNLLDRELQAHAPSPILRLRALPRIPMLAVP